MQSPFMTGEVRKTPAQRKVSKIARRTRTRPEHKPGDCITFTGQEAAKRVKQERPDAT